MTKESIFQEVQNIFAGFFQLDASCFALKTQAGDVEAWDSMNHMELITTIENHFQIQFDFMEVMDFENIEDMVIAIQNRL